MLGSWQCVCSQLPQHQIWQRPHLRAGPPRHPIPIPRPGHPTTNYHPKTCYGSPLRNLGFLGVFFCGLLKETGVEIWTVVASVSLSVCCRDRHWSRTTTESMIILQCPGTAACLLIKIPKLLHPRPKVTLTWSCMCNQSCMLLLSTIPPTNLSVHIENDKNSCKCKKCWSWK